MSHSFWRIIPDWSGIAVLGKSRIARSSYTWLFVVPLAANALSQVNTPLSLTVFDQTMDITLSLPFSWGVLYFSALCFSIGTGVYYLRCPKAISEHNTGIEFEEIGKGIAPLEKYIVEIDEDKTGEYKLRGNLLQYASFHEPAYDPPDSYEEHRLPALVDYYRRRALMAGRAEARGGRDVLPAMYWEIREDAEHIRRYSRLICTVMYLAGLLLAGIVVLQNIGYVLRHMLPHLFG